MHVENLCAFASVLRGIVAILKPQILRPNAAPCRRNPGTIAQQAVKKHKVTVAGVAMLNRLSFVSISLGGGHCVGATDTGLVYTWGQGRYGQLGHGDDLDNIVPRPVQGIKGEVKVASAGFYHSVAVTKQVT